tara:strand:- start:912 stop:1136 length:225 start_codon:yes stop_codon:yes gene_type:complete
MSVTITYDEDNIYNKFDIELNIPCKNSKKNIIEAIFLNKCYKNSKIKYKINIDDINLYTYNAHIINSILNKLIE